MLVATIKVMFLKRKVLSALDRYEDLRIEEYISTPQVSGTVESKIIARAFIDWFINQPGNKKHSVTQIAKCLKDCVQDDYVKLKERSVMLTSRGREISHWLYFLPALLEKLSLKELVTLGVAGGVGLGITLLLAYLGIQAA